MCMLLIYYRSARLLPFEDKTHYCQMRQNSNLFFINILGNKYGHRIAYMGVSINTSLNPAALGYEEGLPIYREWENFISAQVKCVKPWTLFYFN